MILNIIVCDICDDEIDSTEDRYGNLIQDEGAFFNGEHYCEACMNDYLGSCSECGERYYLDDLIYNDNIDDYLCEDCNYNSYDYRELNGYHHSPELTPFGGTWNDRLYGVENEMEGCLVYDTIGEIIDAVGEKVFFQEDGSLDNGMELITHPMTLDYHLNRLGWDDICYIAKRNDFISHDTSTCGLHVHVSKLSLGSNPYERDLTIAKLMIIFDKHWNKIVKFSRRDIGRLERWAKKPSQSYYEEDSEADIIDKSKADYYDRYSAINIRNSDTVEFRVFRGTLKASTIKATLQFIDTIIDYVLITDVQDIFKASFNTIIKNNYDELNNYIIERGI